MRLYSMFAGAALAFAASAVLGAQATPQYRVLYAFTGSEDGAYVKSLIRGADDNFYGTAFGGGTGCGGHGCGSVFKLTLSGQFSTLYEFRGGDDGSSPVGPLTFDKSGNLYGVTAPGNPLTCSGTSCGTVFKIAPDGALTTLHVFTGGKDGEAPQGGLHLGKKGIIFGATDEGGYEGEHCPDQRGCGTIFKLTKRGRETVLHAFTDGVDGSYPNGSLIADAAGNLYGTTGEGGVGGAGFGNGTVFKLAPDGTKTLLYAFQDSDDGNFPEAGLIADRAGNLYGTTSSSSGNICPPDCGAVFELPMTGGEKILHFFTNAVDGDNPTQIVFADSNDDLYGITAYGGVHEHRREDYGGTIFSVGSDGTKTTLYNLGAQLDGALPQSFAKDKAGNLYGVTFHDGPFGFGTVFELTP